MPAPQNDKTHCCRVCGFAGNPAAPLSTPEMFRCRECGTVQVRLLPSVEELRQYYRAYNENYTAGMGHRYSREMGLRFNAKIRMIEAMAGKGRLLDIGSGEGLFLKVATERGFDAVGSDYFPRSQYPRGVEVVPGNLDVLRGLPFPDGTFDIVTLWAVIEHLRDPIAALNEIHRVLKPGGYLFCDTPLCGQASELLAAARSHWFCPPEHLHVFSFKSLRLIHTVAGFEVVRHYASFERTRLRWFARTLRNLLVGVGWGGFLRIAAPSVWRERRLARTTQIGDIQLIVSNSLASPVKSPIS